MTKTFIFGKFKENVIFHIFSYAHTIKSSVNYSKNLKKRSKTCLHIRYSCKFSLNIEWFMVDLVICLILSKLYSKIEQKKSLPHFDTKLSD